MERPPWNHEPRRPPAQDRAFVDLARGDYQIICRVKPGITGLSQLAFVRESQILDPQERIEDYVARVFPQKRVLDRLYTTRRTLSLNVRILAWTVVAFAFGGSVAVHRESGRLGRRRRPAPIAAQDTVQA